MIASSKYPRILRGASVLALLALGLIVFSLVDPRPIPVIVAMSVGQGIGTLSFLAFLVVVVADLRHEQALEDGERSEAPEVAAKSE